MTVNPAFTPVLDAFVSTFNNQHATFAAEANARTATITAARGDKVSPLKYFADSTDESVAELVAKYRKAQQVLSQIEETLADLMAKDMEGNAGSAEEAKRWLEENQQGIRDFNSARRAILKSIANFGMGDDERDYLDGELVSVARPKGSAGNSGIKRPRFESITVNGDALEKPTLTSLAHATKVSKDDIDRALYAAAGVSDLADFAVSLSRSPSPIPRARHSQSWQSRRSPPHLSRMTRQPTPRTMSLRRTTWMRSRLLTRTTRTD